MAITKDYVPKVNPRNKMFANKILELAKSNSIIGVVDVEGLPAPQFQKIRASLKGKAEVLIVKRNLIELSFKELEPKFPGIVDLTSKMSGNVGLVFTNDNPFTLYKFIKKNKSSAPAKPGSIAPSNIIVPAGPTSFSPGPIIGELGAFKIKAGIENGKVAIKADSQVAKEGDVISGALAAILSRLGIEPMEVGLNIKAVYEGGTIFGRSVLDVDEKQTIEDLRVQALESFKLAVGLEYMCKETISTFIPKAFNDALALGVEVAYPAAETLKHLLPKAQSQGVALANTLPEDVRPEGLPVANLAAGNTPVVADNSAANEAKEEKEEKVDAAAGLGSLF